MPRDEGTLAETRPLNVRSRPAVESNIESRKPPVNGTDLPLVPSPKQIAIVRRTEKAAEFVAARTPGARIEKVGPEEWPGFNPRARVGRDSADRSVISASESFNPRARVGRDGVTALWWSDSDGFNPRARVGRDVRMSSIVTVSPVFQSTRPRGARLRNGMARGLAEGFNPRARVGRDVGALVLIEDGIVSIHAPAWGATWPPAMRQSRHSRFNPRARVGRDVES